MDMRGAMSFGEPCDWALAGIPSRRTSCWTALGVSGLVLWERLARSPILDPWLFGRRGVLDARP